MKASPAEDRLIDLAPQTARIPERLLLAHARGQVLFITGAGTSMAAGLPNFGGLVLQMYQVLDLKVHAALMASAGNPGISNAVRATLNSKQCAEGSSYLSGQYDVVLGMLERRMEKSDRDVSNVRTEAISQLRKVRDAAGNHLPPKPSLIHRALMRLANRGRAVTIATTNFDLLLEAASSGKIISHSLGGIPRPGLRNDFAGVLHIHGAMSKSVSGVSEIVLTDRDFGEYYLRRRIVPDFIYDAARLFNIVLVGYSVNDAPMRYLLNAVAADGSRFGDLKERFAFVGMPAPFDEVHLEEWRGRGITPIPYDSADAHSQLARTLGRWADLSAINGKAAVIDRTLRALTRKSRGAAEDVERDLFDHLYRRSTASERLRISQLVSKGGAEIAWLEAMSAVDAEMSRRD